jgi:outer membrane murein-binding lipoprotein Lpp
MSKRIATAVIFGVILSSILLAGCGKFLGRSTTSLSVVAENPANQLTSVVPDDAKVEQMASTQRRK